MSEKIRIGIIGCGTIGSVHADAYAKVKDAEVVALCDILPEKLKEKSEKHKIAKTYDDYHKLLADPEIDALVLARTEAKKAKNFAEADRIRDELKARGIEIIDTPQGAKWRKV